MNNTTKTLWICCLLTVSALTSSGCQGTGLLKIPSRFKKPVFATANDPVREILCLWEPAEGTGIDKLPSRGFAGQILFFSRSQDESVYVNGDVRIYLFDDKGTPEEQEKPIHEFHFDSGSFQKLSGETNIGNGYQIFIPYPKKGNEAVTCSLRVKFTPEDGQPVYSKMAQISLPGRTPSRQEKANSQQLTKTRTNRVQQASYETAESSESNHGESAKIPVSISQLMQDLPRQETNQLDRQQLRERLTELAQSSGNQTPQKVVTQPQLVQPAAVEEEAVEDEPLQPVRRKIRPVAQHPMEAVAKADVTEVTTDSKAEANSDSQKTETAPAQSKTSHPLLGDLE